MQFSILLVAIVFAVLRFSPWILPSMGPYNKSDTIESPSMLQKIDITDCRYTQIPIPVRNLEPPARTVSEETEDESDTTETSSQPNSKENQPEESSAHTVLQLPAKSEIGK